MDELVSILKAPVSIKIYQNCRSRCLLPLLQAGCNIDVKNKLLYVIQTWGLASKNKPTLSYMSDTYSLLKAEGVQFPPINENIDGILLETAAVSCAHHVLVKR